MDENKLHAEAMQKEERLLFGEILDDHPDDTLESTNIVKGNSNELGEKLFQNYINKEICSSYFYGFPTVQRTSSWVGY